MQPSKLGELWLLLEKYGRTIIIECPENLKCVICDELVIDAHQSECGCSFCKKCIDSHFTSNKSWTCPGGKKYCNDAVIKSNAVLSPDAKINIMVTSLVAKCPNDKCEFLGQLDELPNHLECCPKLPVICPYARIGCQEADFTNDTIDKHLQGQVIEHTNMMVDFLHMTDEKTTILLSEFDKNKKQSNTMKKTLSSLTSVTEQQETKIHNLKTELTDANEKISELTTEVEMLKSQLNDLTAKIDVITQKFIEFHRETVDRFSKMESQEKKKEIANKKIVEEQRSNMNTLKEEIVKIEKIKNDVNTSLRQFQEHSRLLSGDLMRLTYGEFIWTIDQFSARRLSAQDGKTEEILSPPFYSHKNGYKLRLKCFPNGVMGLKGQFVCISFYILKGEFDDILEWPFMGTISLSIINQENKEEYQRIEFSYDLTAPQDREVFNRPRSDNVGFGSMNFAKIDNLLLNRSVLKNDTLFLRCTIHPASCS